MITFLSGLHVKLANLYKTSREGLLAWLYFFIATIVSLGIFYGFRNYLAQGMYSKTALSSQYSKLKEYDDQLQAILATNFAKVNIGQIGEITKKLDVLKQEYEKLRLQPRMHLKIFAINIGYNVDQLNNAINERLGLIQDLKDKLWKYKVYLDSVDSYKKFDSCIKHLDFSRDDKNIAQQLDKCVTLVSIDKIKGYSKTLQCNELEKLAAYFEAYKSLSKYYYLLSQKQYKEAQKYKEDARKRIDINIKWNACFDFLGKE